MFPARACSAAVTRRAALLSGASACSPCCCCHATAAGRPRCARRRRPLRLVRVAVPGHRRHRRGLHPLVLGTRYRRHRACRAVPVSATDLGVMLAWLILAENISLIFLLASSIIMVGVILAFRAIIKASLNKRMRRFDHDAATAVFPSASHCRRFHRGTDRLQQFGGDHLPGGNVRGCQRRTVCQLDDGAGLGMGCTSHRSVVALQDADHHRLVDSRGGPAGYLAGRHHAGRSHRRLPVFGIA